MALEKKDLRQIKGVVKEEIGGIRKDLKSTEMRLDNRITGLDNKVTSIDNKVTSLDKKIEDEVGNLAAITVKGFDEVNRRFDKNDQEHKEIKDSINNLEFIATEMVRRDEFLESRRRLEKVEAKTGIK